MSLLLSLLSLPKTSEGLSALQATVNDSLDDGSASPRRKVRRLDADSDSASASRVKRTENAGVPINIRIIGDHINLPQDGLAQTASLKRCIRIILTRNSTESLHATHETIYSTCRSVVTVSNMGENLYDKLKIELEQCIGHMSKALMEAAGDGADWISIFVGYCQWFETKIGLLQSLLTYLDQVYIINKPGLARIREMSFSLFNDGIFGNPQIAVRLRASVMAWVNWERGLRMKADEQDSVKHLVKHLITHSQYSIFEENYLELTRDFYIEESTKLAEKMQDEPKEFFKHCKLRIEEEDARSRTVLPVGSWSIVREVTEKAIWSDRLEWLSNSILGLYMNQKDLSMLGTMYSLFARVNGSKILCSSFRLHIQASVEKIVKDQENDDSMVERLLELKATADATIETCFVDEKVVASTTTASSSAPIPKISNQEFVYALEDAFASGFKARRNKPAEMIAKYLDKAMRKGQGSSADAAFEALLDSVLALYRFTDDKDVFRTFYHRSLAKRLLLEKSASDDFEAAMLKKLKQQYDPEFGMGEDMFKDLALSRESMREYHSKLDRDSPGQILTVMVLQRSAWPFTVQKSIVDLPPNMQAELTAYADYYRSRHSGHTIDWDHALGTATLKGRFDAGSKELSVSLYQAIILLLFNDIVEISFKDIKENTRMDDAELRRTLQSLACGKKKVLKKIPPGKDVENEDIFRYNPDFYDPRAKVHINSIQAKVSVEESKRTNISIAGDRKHYLDAAIVRIMKARKEMTYEQLKTATIDAVKRHFVPQVDIIKKRIDSLVESDYLERSKEDRNVFHYVA